MSNYSMHERAISDFIAERRYQRCIVTVRNIISKLNEIYPEAQGRTTNSKRLWAYRFFKRCGFSIRKVTRSVQVNEQVLTERRNCFFREVETTFYSNQQTVFLNMDQTSIVFGLQHRSTVEIAGMSSVQIASHCSGALHATALLSATSTGEKLPPMLIFKGRPNQRIEREFARRDLYPSGVNCAVQARGWTDESIFRHWLNETLLPTAHRYGCEQVCLVLDSFRVHSMQFVHDFLNEHGIRSIIIPGGLTSELQPMDVGINGPLKHWLREFESAREPGTFNASQKRVHLAEMLKQAWDAINTQAVINSFNAMLQKVTDDPSLDDEVFSQ